MAYSFDLLPVELQASVTDLRAAGVGASIIDTLVDRTLAALVTKSNKVQVQVWQIEEHLGQQLAQIGDKLQADLQTQHGETNGMLVELRQAQMRAHPQIWEARQDVADLKKAWAELADWRGRIEAALAGLSEFREESTDDRQAIRDAVRDLDQRHGGQIHQIVERLSEIERLLEIAGQHEAGG